MNKALIIGRLGSDPESRAIQGGTMCNFSVATSEKFTTKNGDAKETTEWHKIVTFGKLAEICAKYLLKGAQILVEGKIQTRSYEDKDGVKKYSTEIVASNVQFLDSKKVEQRNDDDEIPF